MFAQTSPKPKFNVGSGGAYRSANSRNRFVNDLNNNEHKLLNQSFDTAERHLRRSHAHLKQTTLYIRPNGKKPKLEYTAQQTNATKTEFLLMPVPAVKSNYELEHKPNLNKTFCGVMKNEHPYKSEQFHNSLGSTSNGCGLLNTSTLKDKLEPSNTHALNAIMAQKGRDMIALFGKVDFCVKTHKLNPDVNVLWSVYGRCVNSSEFFIKRTTLGKLLKLMPGKNKFEHILCLRNDNIGPVLQCVYYDFNGTSTHLSDGDYVRVVGRMNSVQRLRTFVVEKISASVWVQSFTRFYNITEFCLAQRTNENKY